MHFKWLKAGAGASKSTDQSSNAFKAGSEFKTSVSGGDPTDLTNWETWEKTFYAAPALIRYTLRPVSELLPQGMEAIANNVDRAVTEYAGAAAMACQAEADQLKALNERIAQKGLYGGVFILKYKNENCQKDGSESCFFKNTVTGACTCPPGYSAPREECTYNGGSDESDILHVCLSYS